MGKHNSPMLSLCNRFSAVIVSIVMAFSFLGTPTAVSYAAETSSYLDDYVPAIQYDISQDTYALSPDMEAIKRANDDRYNFNWPWIEKSTTSTVTINAQGGENYKWQSSDREYGVYEDIPDATVAEYSFTPTNKTWYRCVIDDVPTRAILLEKTPLSDGTAQKNSFSGYWYARHGTAAYTCLGGPGAFTNFDVMGQFEVPGGATYWVNTAYSAGWQIRTSTSPTPNPGQTDAAANLKHFRFHFKDDNPGTVFMEGDLGDGAHGLSFGSDTQIGAGSPVASQSDSCALVYEETAKRRWVRMIGSAPPYQDTDVAMVIQFNTPQDRIWLGQYSSRIMFGNTTTHEVSRIDSGMTASWINISDHGTISWQYGVGSVATTGALATLTASMEHKSANGDYTADPIDVVAGDEIEYKATIVNDGNANAEDYTLEIPIPQGLTIVPGSITDGGELVGDKLTWNLTNLDESQERTVTFKVKVPKTEEATDYELIATTTWKNTPRTSNSLHLLKPAAANLSIEKKQGTPSDFGLDTISNAQADDIVAYQLKVTNSGHGNADNVKIEDVLPEGMSVVTGSVNFNGTTSKDGNKDKVEWNLGELVSGADVIVSFAAYVPQTEQDSSWENTATVSYNDSNREIKTATSTGVNVEKRGEGHIAESIVQAVTPNGYGDAISNTQDPIVVKTDDEITFTMSAANDGKGPARYVNSGIELPTGFSVVETSDNVSIDGTLITWKEDELEVGKDTKGYVKIKVPQTDQPATWQVKGITSYTHSNAEPAQAVETNVLTITKDGKADIDSVLLQALNDGDYTVSEIEDAFADDIIYYKLDLVNNGFGTAHDVKAELTLPQDYTIIQQYDKGQEPVDRSPRAEITAYQDINKQSEEPITPPADEENTEEPNPPVDENQGNEDEGSTDSGESGSSNNENTENAENQNGNAESQSIFSALLNSIFPVFPFEEGTPVDQDTNDNGNTGNSGDETDNGTENDPSEGNNTPAGDDPESSLPVTQTVSWEIGDMVPDETQCLYLAVKVPVTADETEYEAYGACTFIHVNSREAESDGTASVKSRKDGFPDVKIDTVQIVTPDSSTESEETTDNTEKGTPAAVVDDNANHDVLDANASDILTYETTVSNDGVSRARDMAVVLSAPQDGEIIEDSIEIVRASEDPTTDTDVPQEGEEQDPNEGEGQTGEEPNPDTQNGTPSDASENGEGNGSSGGENILSALSILKFTSLFTPFVPLTNMVDMISAIINVPANATSVFALPSGLEEPVVKSDKHAKYTDRTDWKAGGDIPAFIEWLDNNTNLSESDGLWKDNWHDGTKQGLKEPAESEILDMTRHTYESDDAATDALLLATFDGLTEQEVTDSVTALDKKYATAYGSYLLDHPEKFFLNPTYKSVHLSVKEEKDPPDGSDTFKLYYMMVIGGKQGSVIADGMKESDIIANNTAINGKAAALLEEGEDELLNGSKYAKVVLFADFLDSNGNSAASASDSLGKTGAAPLIDGKRFGPEAYAKAMKILCDQAGIECAISSKDYEPETWNIIKLDDDKWYAFDIAKYAENTDGSMLGMTKENLAETHATFNDKPGNFEGALELSNEPELATGDENYKLLDPICIPDSVKATVGDKLQDHELANLDGNTEGRWEWQEPETELNQEGNFQFKANFYPQDDIHYKRVKDIDVTVEVSHAASKISARLASTVMLYTGQPLTPSVTVYYNYGADVMPETEYTVTYRNNTQIGTATVIINPSEGSKFSFEPITLTFSIVISSQGDLLVGDDAPDGIHRYGDTYALTIEGAEEGGEVEYTLLSGKATLTDDGKVTPTDIGDIAIKVSSSLEGFAPAETEYRFKAFPRKLTSAVPSIDNKAYDGTSKGFSATPDITGILEADKSGVNVKCESKFDNKYPGENKQVTTFFTLSGSKAHLYEAPDPITSTATITKAQVEGNVSVEVPDITVADRTYLHQITVPSKGKSTIDGNVVKGKFTWSLNGIQLEATKLLTHDEYPDGLNATWEFTIADELYEGTVTGTTNIIVAEPKVKADHSDIAHPYLYPSHMNPDIYEIVDINADNVDDNTIDEGTEQTPDDGTEPIPDEGETTTGNTENDNQGQTPSAPSEEQSENENETGNPEIQQYQVSSAEVGNIFAENDTVDGNNTETENGDDPVDNTTNTGDNTQPSEMEIGREENSGESVTEATLSFNGIDKVSGLASENGNGQFIVYDLGDLEPYETITIRYNIRAAQIESPIIHEQNSYVLYTHVNDRLEHKVDTAQLFTAHDGTAVLNATIVQGFDDSNMSPEDLIAGDGQDIFYHVTITNDGQGTAKNIAAQVPFDEDLILVDTEVSDTNVENGYEVSPMSSNEVLSVSKDDNDNNDGNTENKAENNEGTTSSEEETTQPDENNENQGTEENAGSTSPKEEETGQNSGEVLAFAEGNETITPDSIIILVSDDQGIWHVQEPVCPNFVFTPSEENSNAQTQEIPASELKALYEQVPGAYDTCIADLLSMIDFDQTGNQDNSDTDEPQTSDSPISPELTRSKLPVYSVHGTEFYGTRELMRTIYQHNYALTTPDTQEETDNNQTPEELTPESIHDKEIAIDGNGSELYSYSDYIDREYTGGSADETKTNITYDLPDLMPGESITLTFKGTTKTDEAATYYDMSASGVYRHANSQDEEVFSTETVHAMKNQIIHEPLPPVPAAETILPAIPQLGELIALIALILLGIGTATTIAIKKYRERRL